VLRVDSPGGSAIASDVIWREVELTRAVKPVIASMSDVAASGGYYIAMPAHKIVAEPATLTGSIGVVMVKFVIDGTLKKLGMNMEGVSSGRYANLYSPIRPFSPEERAKVQEQMQATYDAFVEKAAAGRHTTPEKIDAIAQGRVWTGRQAKEIGLVDELGGLDRALVLAKEAAKIGRGRGNRAGGVSAEAVALRIDRQPVRRLGPQRAAVGLPRPERAPRAHDADGAPARLPARESRWRLCLTCL
jgi:protease-4